MLALALAILTWVGTAPESTPAWTRLVKLPADVVPTEGTLVEHDYDEGMFLEGTAPTPKRGRFSTFYLTRLPEGFHEPSASAWAKWEPLLRASGWVLKGHDGDSYSLQRKDASGEAWLSLGLAEYLDPKLTIVQVSGGPRVIDLTSPAPKPATVATTGDWPFLAAPAGSRLEDTGVVEEPLDVTAGDDREPHLVGGRYINRRFTPPANLSKLETELAYAAALARAGWTVLPRPKGVPEGEGVVRAHYAAGGRDIWAVVGRGNDDGNTGLGINVADVGGENWAASLATTCRLPLYGVTFDFDRATLRPESGPILQKAADALAADPSLVVEVQGHTDDVGDDAYNLRLSGQRAEAVRAWLAQHGVAASRLSSRGYGKAHPVVENSSDANRARNRRVELACTK